MWKKGTKRFIENDYSDDNVDESKSHQWIPVKQKITSTFPLLPGQCEQIYSLKMIFMIICERSRKMKNINIKLFNWLTGSVKTSAEF